MPTFEEALGAQGPDIVVCTLQIVKVMESFPVNVRFRAHDLAATVAATRRNIHSDNQAAREGREGYIPTAIVPL